MSKPSNLEEQVASISQGSALNALTRIKQIVANADGYGPDQIRLILETAQTLEVRAKQQRPAVRQALRNALKKLTSQAGLTEVLDASVNIPVKPDPTWDNARLYFRAVKTTGRQFLVSQICLGWELHNRKQALGFVHGNNQHARTGQLGQSSKTWEQYLKDELGDDLPRRTADRLILVYQGFCEKCPKKIRVMFEGTGKRSLITALSKPPSTITAKDRATIETAIAKASDGETQRSLLEELSLVKVHKALTGGDTSAHKKHKPTDAELMGQLAFKFFKPIAEQLQTFRASSDRDAYLATLDITTSDEGGISLTTLEVDLEAALETVRAAKNAKMKTAPGKVIS
jgi:hypothetical protein